VKVAFGAVLLRQMSGATTIGPTSSIKPAKGLIISGAAITSPSNFSIDFSNGDRICSIFFVAVLSFLVPVSIVEKNIFGAEKTFPTMPGIFDAAVSTLFTLETVDATSFPDSDIS